MKSKTDYLLKTLRNIENQIKNSNERINHLQKLKKEIELILSKEKKTESNKS